MKNYKLVLALVAGLAIGSTVGLAKQPVKSEASVKYETIEQAGKRVYKSMTKAYKGKKKVTGVLYYKTKDYKNISKFGSALDKAVAKAIYGNLYEKGSKSPAWDYLYVKESVKKIKSGVYRYKYTINGTNKYYRRDYRETEYGKKLLNDLLPLTEGKSQFDKAFITMAWFQGRAGYQCGKDQDNSSKALWKRNYHADCDDLAGDYAGFAKCAGVKKVGVISDEDHSWNYIVVKGRMYFIDFQSWYNGSNDGPQPGRKNELSAKALVEKMNDIEYLMKEWSDLKWINGWYKKNVDADAKDEITVKAVLNKMPKEQKTYLCKEYTNVQDKYTFSCDSWSQSFFQPAKVFCSTRGNGNDWTVKQLKKFVPKKLKKYVW